MRKLVLPLLLIYCLIIQLSAQVTPAQKQSEAILLLNGVAHIGNGEKIENSAITIEDGKIVTIADATVVNIKKEDYKVYELNGAHVYPGLIAAYTELGLLEVEAVRATDDTREVGTFNPNVRSIIAYNTDSQVTPTIRSNGILMAQVVPSGGRIMGTSSVVQLDAWNYEDAIVKEDDGVWINWPAKWRFRGFWAGGGVVENKKYGEAVTALMQFMEEASAYCKASEHKVANLKFDAMCGCFKKTVNTYINVDEVKEIVKVLDFAETHNLKLVLSGARDAHLIADMIAEKEIPIILRPIHRLPTKEDDPVDLPYRVPSILEAAGITFALTTPDFSGDLRNLPFHAGTAAANGLEAEAAIKAITSSPAKIFGIDDKYGSLEKGKSATLFVSKGDILEIKDHQVIHAFIDGRKIDLGNKQVDLYEKFMKKYDLKVSENPAPDKQ